jgi:hypothetical protein
MASRPQNQLCPDLTPWKPTPTQLPQDWIHFSNTPGGTDEGDASHPYFFECEI